MKEKKKIPLRERSVLSRTNFQEEFLHYVWKYKLFPINEMYLVSGEKLTINHSGKHNFDSGPDFFNAKIFIDDQLWAGNVEVHLKSSDWYVHGHETDDNYDAVILHVVWENDVPVLDKNGIEYPTLELKDFVFKNTIVNYNNLLFQKNKWVLCEEKIGSVDQLIKESWLSRLYFERLENKAKVVKELLAEKSNDWEQVLFLMLFKNFGLKLNGVAFFNLANSFEFSVFRKLQNTDIGLESLMFGQAGFLNDEKYDLYFLDLKKEFNFLKKKHKLTPVFKNQIQFFRLRPANFPTIRISQFTSLYKQNKSLFTSVVKSKKLEDLYELFQVKTSEYWESHYSFGKISKKQQKRITKSFIDLLIINTILPIKYLYMKSKGEHDFEELENLIRAMKPEKNSIIENFDKLGLISSSAFYSQALLELKNNYCNHKKCLQCSIGLKILNRK